jgi:peptide chain release factor 2
LPACVGTLTLARPRSPYAYGWLRLERGAHRLIRFSPFKANSQRHTSLCGVDVVPAAARAGAAPIVIGRGDVRVDTFRAQGAGGQHVNTTESAVRITHIPTGISVKCQQERSQVGARVARRPLSHALGASLNLASAQMQNRALAMEWLRAKLQQRSEEALRAQHVEADAPDFGATVVRTVYLHPAQMVKDHRTGAESRDVDAFLDGDMTASLEAALRHASSASAVASACSTP